MKNGKKRATCFRIGMASGGLRELIRTLVAKARPRSKCWRFLDVAGASTAGGRASHGVTENKKCSQLQVRVSVSLMASRSPVFVTRPDVSKLNLSPELLSSRRIDRGGA
ncbi:unnamed protein product [Soboliphyme baturini]|uniref:Uncharacterized protein n=1 Tax=Soboliphyme baturini TaxID=241478 RepID=A0A183J3B0_9BILA|nr:unnamed protein product [Soboliphyme baturini]